MAEWDGEWVGWGGDQSLGGAGWNGWRADISTLISTPFCHNTSSCFSLDLHQAKVLMQVQVDTQEQKQVSIRNIYFPTLHGLWFPIGCSGACIAPSGQPLVRIGLQVISGFIKKSVYLSMYSRST